MSTRPQCYRQMLAYVRLWLRVVVVTNLLSGTGLVGILLPFIIESGEENDLVVRDGVEDGLDGNALVLGRRNSGTLLLTLVGPASLCEERQYNLFPLE